MFRPPIAGAASMTPILEPGRLITEDLRFAYSSSPGVAEVLALAPSFPVDPVTPLAARPLHILSPGPTTAAAWKFLEEAAATRAREDAIEVATPKEDIRRLREALQVVDDWINNRRGLSNQDVEPIVEAALAEGGEGK